MKKILTILFCIWSSLLCAMDEIKITNKSNIVLSENYLHNGVIANLLVENLSLEDALYLFHIDKVYYEGYFNPVMRIYRRQTPEKIQIQNKTFETFIKIFCTYNNWINDKSINYLVRKKFLSLYTQHHCQKHHFQMLESLGVEVEQKDEESFFYQKESRRLLHVREQEEVINENELQKLNNDLLTAVKDKDFTNCFYALMNGADVNYKNNNEYPILAYCTITEDSSYQIMDLLVDNGLDINVDCDHGARKIYFEVESNNIENVKKLLNYGALPDIGNSEEDSEMDSPLCKAVENGSFQMVKLLLEAGANPCWASTRTKETPLHAVIINVNSDTYHDKIKIAYLLLEYGADLDAKNILGYNPHEYCLHIQKDSKQSKYYWPIIRFFVAYRKYNR